MEMWFLGEFSPVTAFISETACVTESYDNLGMSLQTKCFSSFIK